jgi:hypothetical protein
MDMDVIKTRQAEAFEREIQGLHHSLSMALQEQQRLRFKLEEEVRERLSAINLTSFCLCFR